MAAKVFPIHGRMDVVAVSSQVRRLGQDLGLDRRRSLELAIVVSELASNIVKHGIRGEIVLTREKEPPPRGEIRVEARDIGPPIRDLQLAMTDGCDDQGPIDPALLLGRRGLGTGLGAVARFADRVEYREHAGGKTVAALFLLR